MAYKRYVHKKGKRHGPYYYKNVRDHAGKVRTVYLGKVTTRGKRPLEVAIVFLVALLIIMSALFFIQNRNLVLSKEAAEESKVPFEVDQILIKVLVKENEYVEKEIRVMNVGDNDIPITVELSGVSHLADIIDKDFVIKPGQTKIVRINFTSFDKKEGVEQAPGVYIGNIIAKTDSYQKEIPVIIEIESKNVLFDMNLNPVARDRSVVQGESTTFEIRVFNLQSIESYNVGMEFFVKDTNGNTIVSEEESVVVQTQASFFKTLKIPEKLKTGNYVFVAQASLGKSVGTASYLFEVESDAAKEGGFSRFLGFCRNDPLCWALSVIVLLLMFSIGAYAYFFVGVLIYEKLFGVGIPKRKLEEAQEAQATEEKERNVIIQSFIDFSNWVNKWKEKRLKRKLEYEKKRIKIEEEEEKLKLEFEERKHRVQEEKKRLLGEEKRKEEERKKAEEEEKKKQEEQRIRGEEDKAGRRGLFGKCKFLIGKGYDALNKNNLWKADRIYAKLITFYSALEDESKAEIFKDINSFYKSLLLKKSQIKAEKEENRRKAEEERKRAEEQRRKEAEERKRLSKAEAEIRKEQLKKSWQIVKKTGFGFLRRLGLAKTEQEKKELEKIKQEEAKRRAGEMLRAEEERKKRAEESQKLNQLRKMKAEEEVQNRKEQARLIEEEKKKVQEQKIRHEEEYKKARAWEEEEKKKQQELMRKQREEQARKKEEERKKRAEERRKIWAQRKKNAFELFHNIGLVKTEQEKKELEKKRLEEAKRRAGEMLRAEEEKRAQEEAERKRKEEEKRRIEEGRESLHEEKRKQLELEKKKAEEERKRAFEEEKRQEELRKKQKEGEERLKQEERRKWEEAIRKQREEEQRKKEEVINKKEEEKKKKLGEIKLLEDNLDEKNANIAKLKEKINAEYEDLKSIGKEIYGKERDVEGLQNEKGMLFKMYNDSLENKKELSKERENKIAEWKQRYDAKISEKSQLANEAKQQYENNLKELEDELKGLSAKEKAEQEKWRKLELKAKYKLEEKEREREVREQIKELLEEKKSIESEFKGKRQSAAKGISGKDILEKQNAINDHIRQHESEIADLKKKIGNKESLIERHKSSIERLEEERTNGKIELLEKKKSLGGINYLHSILKVVESIKMRAKKPLREKEKQAKKEEEREAEKEKQKGLFSIFKKKEYGEVTEEQIKEHEAIEKEEEKPGFIGSIFKAKEDDKDAEKKKREIAAKRKDKSRKFIKCHKVLLKGEEALSMNDIGAAKKAYLKARNIYINLEYHEKKEIYKELNELYNKLSGKV